MCWGDGVDVDDCVVRLHRIDLHEQRLVRGLRSRGGDPGSGKPGPPLIGVRFPWHQSGCGVISSICLDRARCSGFRCAYGPLWRLRRGASRDLGLGPARIWLLHIAKPALPPALALLTYSAAGAVAGTTAIEVVFDIPGLGSTLVEAVRTQDVPLVQGGLVVAAVAALAIGALGDAATLAADPRTRRRAPV